MWKVEEIASIICLAYRVSKLNDLIQYFENLWPLESAETWDKPGLLLGSPSQEIAKVLLTVDVTSDVVLQAKQIGANLVVSHHPLFLKGVHLLSEDGFRGALAAGLIRHNIALFSAHTNADAAEDGVTELLAKRIGLEKLSKLDGLSGHGRIGHLRNPQSLMEFSRNVARNLPPVASGIKIAGDADMLVQKIAVLGGAGDSYLSQARNQEVDVYITSDLRHHPAQEFMEQSKLEGGKPALIDISHWAAEWIWLDNLAKRLNKEFSEVEFVVCDLRTDPWDFAVMQ